MLRLFPFHWIKSDRTGVGWLVQKGWASGWMEHVTLTSNAGSRLYPTCWWCSKAPFRQPFCKTWHIFRNRTTNALTLKKTMKREAYKEADIEKVTTSNILRYTYCIFKEFWMINVVFTFGFSFSLFFLHCTNNKILKNAAFIYIHVKLNHHSFLTQ